MHLPLEHLQYGLDRDSRRTWRRRALASEEDNSSECELEFAFQGQFLDVESGLLNYGYRYYLPFLGRGIAKDPIGTMGGLNIYGMAGNGPVNGVDYLGLYGGGYTSGSPYQQGVGSNEMYSMLSYMQQVPAGTYQAFHYEPESREDFIHSMALLATFWEDNRTNPDASDGIEKIIRDLQDSESQRQAKERAAWDPYYKCLFNCEDECLEKWRAEHWILHVLSW